MHHELLRGDTSALEKMFESAVVTPCVVVHQSGAGGKIWRERIQSPGMLDSGHGIGVTAARASHISVPLMGLSKVRRQFNGARKSLLGGLPVAIERPGGNG